MHPSVIDAFEFCRLKERREDAIPVAELVRLKEDTADQSGIVHWILQGGSDNFGHPMLTLSISGTVKLMCQRCLTSFAFDISSESTLILAKNEANVDEIDVLLADESVDIIVGSDAMNIAELIEDEALLALPLSPKHDICPDKAALNALERTEKVSPFAVLKNTKH